MRRLTALLDRAAVNAAILGNRSSTADQLSLAERFEQLDALESEWHREDWLSDPDAFFGAPRTVEPSQKTLRERWGRTLVDLEWPSAHRALDPEVAEHYQRFGHNATARARWFRSDRPRRTAILFHGYMGGEFRSEARVFPVRRWLAQDMDVVLFALPFHGPRRAPGDRVRFPSSMPHVTVEGFRQTVSDARDLVGILTAAGAPEVAAVGMSLGGYTTALLATVEPRLAFAMPFIPLASLADYAAGHGRFIGSPEEQRRQQEQLERVYAVVSPLGRPAVLAPEQLLVAGGEFDRITPIRHAEKIAEHFGCELLRFGGAHLLQVGRRKAWQRFEERWA